MNLKHLYQEFANEVSEVRNSINERGAFHSFLAKTKEWNQICSALDTLDDTALAMDAYWNVPFNEDSQNDGSAYLYIYGLLQAMYVQQDAIMDLARCFQLSINLEQEYTFMGQARQKRNWAIGHPTRSRHPHDSEDSYHHTISRPYVFRYSFDLVSADSKGSLRQSVLPGDLCAGQFREGKEALQGIKNEILKNREAWLAARTEASKG